MRTIEFRGRRVDNGEWVYGYVDATMYKDIVVIHTETGTFEVDPETIGQFTGLHDKNGKPIYEGDILRYTRHNVKGEGIHNETWVHECIVYWNEEKHAFWHRMRVSCGYSSGLLIFEDERAEKAEIEVIGDIHNNHRADERRRGTNHDIAHCNAQYYIFNKYGECEERHCSLKKKCKRHKAFLDLNGDETSPIAFISAYECVTRRHKLYWYEDTI